jgi:GT2 family glycosyltransferase
MRRRVRQLTMHLSVIVPFHRGLVFLDRCLAAFDPLPPGSEIIVVADGAVEDCRPLAARYGANVIEIDGPSGPGTARNRAATAATGDILVFVDTDVVIDQDALLRLARVLDDSPEMAAVFGAYNETPANPEFVSQYKNLAHAYVHRTSGGVSQTFWAGFGAVRRQAFLAVGGFDERFGRPSVEDIDLGYRLTQAGYRLVLDPSLTACHLKRWTLWSMIVSDVKDRGIPWTQLILRYGGLHNDLNLKSAHRLCVVLAYAATASLALSPVDARFLVIGLAALGAIVFLGRDYYSHFYRQRGLWFAVRVVPLHFLYHLYNGVAFAVGSALFFANRRVGIHLPGALPRDAWRRPQLESSRMSAGPESHAACMPADCGSHAGARVDSRLPDRRA